MELISVRVDATSGVRVSRGARVERGQAIGLSPHPDCLPVLSPEAGTVQYISFDADTHTLIISIEAEPQGFGVV